MKEALENALLALKNGGIILYPTDTIWGLGCDATNEKAVEKIYQLKKRADSKSLVCLVGTEAMLERHVKEVPEIAWQLISINTEPLTIVYPQAMGIAKNAVAEDNSIAIRLPKHEFCEQLIRRFNRPIISTSANISGEPSPLHYEEVNLLIKDAVDYIVPSALEGKCTRKASSIIKLACNGEVTIIRK